MHNEVKWRVIPLETHNAAANMAIDEAVLNSVASGKSRPTIRFYRWNPSAVSIGYFQSLEDEIDLQKCKEHKVDFVRRWTGGGAVYHDYDGEITYSVIAPEKIFPKGITESYHLICDWIVKSLANIGINAEFKPINDIITNGKKISGNAQTRRNGILLQHGTILYKVDVKKMFSLLKVPDEKIRDKMIQTVEERVTSICQQKECTLDELQDALLRGFTSGKKWEFGKLNVEEAENAKSIAQNKYAGKEWNFMR